MRSSLGVAGVVLAAVALAAVTPCSAAGVPPPGTPTAGEFPSELSVVRQVRDLLKERSPNHPFDLQSGLVDFVRLGNSVLFRAWDGIHGWELWRTDGTSQGTALLKDICLGDCSSYPRELRHLRGFVYFEAQEGDHGTAIWRTDGTADGTQLVVDVPKGRGSLRRSYVGPFLTEFQDGLYFVTDDGIHGSELWRSDGAPGGTAELVSDIWQGPEGSQPSSLYVVGETLYFSADDGVHGRELWRSDGSPEGTEQVRDICPGPESCLWMEQVSPPAGPWIFASVGDRLLLITTDGGSWDELWVSDGTAEGTRRVLDLQVGGILFPFRSADGSVLLSARGASEGYELWRTDGTEPGTYLVRDIHEGPLGSYPSVVAASDGIVYFGAHDEERGRELWKTDGTEAGTVLVKDINPGPSSALKRTFFPLVPDPGSQFAYFDANDGETGYELWRSDGTSAGTFLLEDINPGEASAFLSWWAPVFATELNDRLIFYAISSANRFELWSTDGSSGGTERLHPIDLQASAMERLFPYLEPEIAAIPDSVLFGAFGEQGGELWATQGASSGTLRIRSFCEPGCWLEGFARAPLLLTAVDDLAFFLGPAPSEQPNRLWVSDGSAQGTGILETNPSIENPWYLTAWEDFPDGHPRLAFTAVGEGLYVSDGTPEGTNRLTSGDCSAAFPTPAGDQMFFSCGWPDQELWVSKGAAGDAHRVLDIAPGEFGSHPQLLTALGSQAVFSADDGVSGREMWVSDGTAAGTHLLRDVRPGPESSVRGDRYGGFMAATSHFVYFAADDGFSGEELWRTDGTSEGTLSVADLNPGPDSSEPRPWVAMGSTMLFSAWDPVHGRELRQADERSGETRLVVDLNPGPHSGVSDILVDQLQVRPPQSEPVVWRGRLHFAGTDGQSGVELWSTDGTACGTRRLADIHPGPGSSSPRGFTPFDSKLFFSATDGVTGYELWVVESPISARGIFSDGFESGDSSAWSRTIP